MTKKPDVTIDDISEMSAEELDKLEIKQAGPEEKAALLEAFKNKKVVFAPGAEEDMAEHGLTIDDIIAMLTKEHKGNLN